VVTTWEQRKHHEQHSHGNEPGSRRACVGQVAYMPSALSHRDNSLSPETKSGPTALAQHLEKSRDLKGKHANDADLHDLRGDDGVADRMHNEAHSDLVEGEQGRQWPDTQRSLTDSRWSQK